MALDPKRPTLDVEIAESPRLEYNPPLRSRVEEHLYRSTSRLVGEAIAMNRVALRYVLPLAAIISNRVGVRADTPAEVSLQGHFTKDENEALLLRLQALERAVKAR